MSDGSLPPPTGAPAPQPEPQPGPPVPAADGGWHRVHWLSPVLRSWQVVVVIVAVVAQDLAQQLGTSGDRGGALGRLSDEVPIGGLIAVALFALAVGLATLSWRFTRYRVTEHSLDVHSGVLARRQRRAPLDRLQAVDIVEPLVGRLLGLARLTLEVAGSGDSRIELAYLKEADARRLRNHLLAVAAGLRSDHVAPPQVGEAPEREVLTVPLSRLVGSTLLQLATPALVLVLVVVVVTSAATDNAGLGLAGGVPILLATVSAAWGRLTSGFGFRVAAAPDGVRIRHGMLEQRTQTVPPGRVQAVEISQPFLWRLTGWWTVQVNVAGYGAGGNDGTVRSGTLLPVGTGRDALTVLAFVLPGIATDLDLATALAGARDADGFVTSPRRARWADPLGWRRRGFRVTDSALVLRNGAIHRHVVVVPHARTQSCGVRQGALQRRLCLASFELHSTPGPIRPRVDHLASDVAGELLEAQAARARAARRSARDEWLAPASTTMPPSTTTT